MSLSAEFSIFIFASLPLTLVSIFDVAELTTNDTVVVLPAIGKSFVPSVIDTLPDKFLKSGKNLLMLRRNWPSPSTGKSKSPDCTKQLIASSVPLRFILLTPLSCSKYVDDPNLLVTPYIVGNWGTVVGSYSVA